MTEILRIVPCSNDKHTLLLKPHPRDTNLVLFCVSGILVIQDVTDENVTHYLSSCSSPISTIIVTSDGRFCLVGHMGLSTLVGQPSPIYVWDLTHRLVFREVLSLAGSVICMSLSHDNRFACAIGDNSMLIVFEVELGEIVYSRRFDELPAMCVFAPVWSSETYKFVTVSETGITVFRMRFDLCQMKFLITSDFSSFGHVYRRLSQSLVVSDFDHVLLSSATGDLLVYNIEQTPYLISSHSIGQPVTQMTLLRSRKQIAMVIGSKKIVLVDFFEPRKNSELIVQNYVPLDIGNACITCLEYANNVFYVETNLGTRLRFDEISGTQKKIAEFMLSPAKKSFFISGKNVPVCSSVSASNAFQNFLILGYENGSVRSSGWEIASAHRGAVGALALRESLLITGGAMDSTVRVWTVNNLTVKSQFTQSSGGITHILIESDDLFYYATDRREIFAVSISREKILVKFNSNSFGHVTGMEPVRIPTKRDPTVSDPAILTSHEEGKVVCWDIDFKDCLFVLEGSSGMHFSCMCLTASMLVLGDGYGKLATCEEFLTGGSDKFVTRELARGFENERIVHLHINSSVIYATTESGIVLEISLFENYFS